MQRIQVQIILYIPIGCFYLPSHAIEFPDLIQREFIFVQIGCDAFVYVIADLETYDAKAKFKERFLFKMLKPLVSRNKFIDFRMCLDFVGLFCR